MYTNYLHLVFPDAETARVSELEFYVKKFVKYEAAR